MRYAAFEIQGVIDGSGGDKLSGHLETDKITYEPDKIACEIVRIPRTNAQPRFGRRRIVFQRPGVTFLLRPE
jgi:hypothetical protein